MLAYRRRLMVSSFALGALLISAVASHAAAFTVFGPSTYVRRSGPPAEDTTKFVIPPHVRGPLKLIVQSGRGDGSGRVTSASIEVNGIGIIGPADFKPQVASLTRDTSLVPGESVTLRVRLSGAPGSSMTVALEGDVSPDEPLAEESSTVVAGQDTVLRLPGVATLTIPAGTIPGGGEVQFTALLSPSLDIHLSTQEPSFVPLDGVPTLRVKSATSVVAPVELRIAVAGISEQPVERPIFAMALLNQEGAHGESADMFGSVGGDVCEPEVLCVTLPVESFLKLNPLDPADPVAIVRVGTLQPSQTAGQRLWTVSRNQGPLVLDQGQPITVDTEVALQIPASIALRNPLPAPSPSPASHYWRQDGRFHGAVDIPVVEGTAVSAALAGDVFATSDGARVRAVPLSCGNACTTSAHCGPGLECLENPANGRFECHVTKVGRGEYVMLSHAGGDMLTWYQHLRKPPTVQSGDSVRIGDSIGESGRTPETAVCGAHLHFASQFIWDGRPYTVDPEPLLQKNPALFLGLPAYAPAGAEPVKLRFSLSRRGAPNSLARIDRDMSTTPFAASATFTTTGLQPGEYEIVLSLRGSRLNAPPNPGIRLASWDVTLLAPLQLTVAGSGSGTVATNPPGSPCGGNCRSFPANTTVQVVASPNPGSTFDHWTGDCSGSATTSVIMDGPKTCGAVFRAGGLHVAPAGAGQGSVVSQPSGVSCPQQCDGEFAPGTIVTLTAMPKPGSTFVNWGGDCSGNNPTTTVTISGNMTCTANFGLPTLTFTLIGEKLTPWKNGADAGCRGARAWSAVYRQPGSPDFEFDVYGSVDRYALSWWTGSQFIYRACPKGGLVSFSEDWYCGSARPQLLDVGGARVIQPVPDGMYDNWQGWVEGSHPSISITYANANIPLVFTCSLP